VLFYAICSLAFMLGDMFPRLLNAFQPIMDIKYFLAKDMVVIVTFIICFFVFILLIVFFMMHLRMVANSLTTIEYKEKLGREPFFRAAHTKFDYGYYQNWCHILGPPWMWFLPISAPADDFVTLQSNYIKSLPPCKSSASESARQELLTHLKSKTARQEFIREAGCYYTPLPDNFELWKLSIPDPDEKPSRGRGGLRSPVPGGDEYVPSSPSPGKKEKFLNENGEPRQPLGIGLSSEDEAEESEEEGDEGGRGDGGEEGDGVMIHGPGGEGGVPIREEEVASQKQMEV